MTDFTDLITQAKKMQEKMKDTQEALKKIEVEGISGGNAIRIIMKVTRPPIPPNTIKSNPSISMFLIS